MNSIIGTHIIVKLTRGNMAGAITIPMTSGGPIVVQPNTTAMVIIDMQNFFLHESLNGDPKGRAVVRKSGKFTIRGQLVYWDLWPT